MATLSNAHPHRSFSGHRVLAWIHSSSLRGVGIMTLLLALLLTLVSYALHTLLYYPEVLLDKLSFATSLLAQSAGITLLSFIGSLLCGMLLLVISLALVPHIEEKRRRSIFITGSASGICLIVGALIGLILIPLWSSTFTSAAQFAATILFILTEVATPLLLLCWTIILAKQFRVYKMVGISGLSLILLRSLIWGLNALLPITSGLYGTAGVVNILSLLGESLWLFWLLLLSLRLFLQPTMTILATPQAAREKSVRMQIMRRRFLKSAVGMGVGIVGTAFVGGRIGLTIANSPDLEGDDVPSEPTLLGTLTYLMVTAYLRLNPITTVEQQLAVPLAKVPLSPGVSLEHVNASGVPAQFIRVPGASKNRVILYIHGGGWAVPLQDQDRVEAANLSQQTGASVLLPAYRLLPDHPFPAGLQDCVTTYRWLRSQGIAASHIVIMGGSAGANLTLATAVSLRESGEKLPAALVAMSAPTDLAMTGETYRTKALVDPVLGSGLAKNTYAAYTREGAIDAHNPLVSPLYANVQGFSPTFLQVGTQEILLSDSTRMANHLKAAGVEVKLEAWPGMFHGWQSQSFIPEARLANQHIVKFIRQHLGA